jgi:hypothetical protein
VAAVVATYTVSCGNLLEYQNALAYFRGRIDVRITREQLSSLKITFEYTTTWIPPLTQVI